MKKFTLSLVTFMFILAFLNAQNTSKQNAEKYISLKGELTFTFTVSDDNVLEDLTRELSIVHYDPDTNIVKAWANEQQFRNFETRNIPYQVPKKENEVDENLIYDVRPLYERSTSAANLSFPLSTYPTYDEYAAQMQQFQTDYSTLVETFSIGTTTEGDKELWFVKISDNVGTDEQEPKLLYTSSMHGDEIAGYPMMLSLIDYILTVYNDIGHSDHARIKNLVENAEIWINPNANPDGTYYLSGDNTSVALARRGNANDIDLNRNYPDNVDGPHPDGEAYQAETLAFMALADANHFVISANFHGGIELVNYPFDNAYASTTTYHSEDPGNNGPYYTHPDTDWFEFISVEYATHAQTDSDTLGDTNYMTVDYDSYIYPSPGVTHGAEWYRVYGGRQDYMNFYHQCREVTIELSDDKTILESELVDYWLYNKDALLDYLTQGLYGFRGVVKDASTGNPIENATVTIVGHDAYGSHTVSDINFGDFYRPIKAGTYNILIEAPCYDSETLSGESISDYFVNDLGDILLTPNVTIPTSLTATNIQSTSADLSWSVGSSSYDLRYRISGAVSWTIVTGITTESYALTGLNQDTTYEFEVRANCNSLSSSYSTSSSFTTSSISYCSAGGSSAASNYIGIVDINGTPNNTISSTTSGYSDFTGSNIFPNILNLTPTSHSITVTKQWVGNPQKPQAVSAWIDYNQDGVFSGTEKILSSASSNSSTASTSFSIPATAKTGETVLRVLLKKYNSGTNTQNDPCESFADGEVEDYTVFIGFDGFMYANSNWTPSDPVNITSSDNVLIYNGSYSFSSDVAVNEIEVSNNASLTVTKTGSLTVYGDLISNNKLTLESDSNEYSSLIVNGTVTGDVKYKRHVNINTNGNDLISAPVVGQAFGEFATTNTNIYFNPTTTTQKLFGPFDKNDGLYKTYDSVTDASEILTSGTGYRAASTDSNTFTFNGALNTGNVDVTVSNSGPSYTQWNLIGNPYTSYINPVDFIAINTAVFNQTNVAIYGYDGNASDGWTIINSANANSYKITPGQGFFIATDTGGTVTFTPSMRTIGTSDDFIAGRNSNSISHLKIDLAKNTASYATDFYFTENASSGLDPGYDASVFGGSAPSSFAIYSHLVTDDEGIDMAIQSLSNEALNNNTVVPIGLNANQGEQLSISISETTLPENINVYFEDYLTNSVILLNEGDFVFTPSTNLSGIGRFYLRFQNETLSETENEIDRLQIFNTSNPDIIHINGLIHETTVFTMLDLHGRKILVTDLELNKQSQKINIPILSKGVYLISIQNNFKTITKKIIIR